MKKSNGYIIVIAVLILIFGVIIILCINKNSSLPNKNNDIGISCLMNGEICSQEDIYNGIKVEYEVSKSKKYSFYLIDNDEETMTLMMDKNLVNNVHWQEELINFKGPLSALTRVILDCKEWDNVPVITNYSYEDYGYKNYINKCSNNDKYYDCDDLFTKRYGYIKIETDNIGNGISYYNTDNDSNTWKFVDKLKARLITIDEIIKIAGDKPLPNWLVSNLHNNEAYWTLSSAVTLNTNYSYGAYALVNNDGNPLINSLFVQYNLNNNNTIGVRPVITVPKR